MAESYKLTLLNIVKGSSECSLQMEYKYINFYVHGTEFALKHAVLQPSFLVCLYIVGE